MNYFFEIVRVSVGVLFICRSGRLWLLGCANDGCVDGSMGRLPMMTPQMQPCPTYSDSRNPAAWPSSVSILPATFIVDDVRVSVGVLCICRTGRLGLQGVEVMDM